MSRQVFVQVLRRFADLTLAGQEDEDVAHAAAAPELVHCIGDGGVQIGLTRPDAGPPQGRRAHLGGRRRCRLGGAIPFERLPALLHREQAPRHLNHRRRPCLGCEVLRKPIGIDGGRGDDDLQIRPARQQLTQVAEQEIDVQAALVGLVDDDGVVGTQVGVALRLGQQDAIGHQLDRGTRLQPIVEAHLVAHHFAQRRIQLFGNALGHTRRRNAPRLGVADQAAPASAQATAQFQQNLRQLCRLARAGFATHDHHRVLSNGPRNLRTPPADRQRFGIGDWRDRRGQAREAWGASSRRIERRLRRSRRSRRSQSSRFRVD